MLAHLQAVVNGETRAANVNVQALRESWSGQLSAPPRREVPAQPDAVSAFKQRIPEGYMDTEPVKMLKQRLKEDKDRARARGEELAACTASIQRAEEGKKTLLIELADKRIDIDFSLEKSRSHLAMQKTSAPLPECRYADLESHRSSNSGIASTERLIQKDEEFLKKVEDSFRLGWQVACNDIISKKEQESGLRKHFEDWCSYCKGEEELLEKLLNNASG